MKIVGHRGARGLAPENTMASLRKGEEHNVDELEFDLRVTKDKIVVLDHDGFLTDPNGQKRLIAEGDFDELKTHKPDLTTFQEVLESDLKTKFYIEVKKDEPLEQIITLIKVSLNSGRKASTLSLASFSQKILLELHSALPEVEMIVNEKWSGVRATHRANQLGTKRLSMNQRWLWRGFISPMAKRGWKLSAYTLNDPKKAARWKCYGLYGVITDYPDLFQD